MLGYQWLDPDEINPRRSFQKSVFWLEIWRQRKIKISRKDWGGKASSLGTEIERITFIGHTMRHTQLPWPGIEPIPPAVETRRLNHWTITEGPVEPFLNSPINLSLLPSTTSHHVLTPLLAFLHLPNNLTVLIACLRSGDPTKIQNYIYNHI